MSKKRNGIKIQLTPDQIAKLWPILEQLADHNRQAPGTNRTAILGQIEVKDTGRITATAKWVLLTPDEANTVQALLGGTGTTSDAGKERPAAKKCGNIIYYGMGEESQCGRPAVAIVDAGLPRGYPVCDECSEHCHPSRLTKIAA